MFSLPQERNSLRIKPWRHREAREWRYSSTFHDLDSRRRWSNSGLYHFTPRGKRRRYPLERRLGGPQSRSGCSGGNSYTAGYRILAEFCPFTNWAIPSYFPGVYIYNYVHLTVILQYIHPLLGNYVTIQWLLLRSNHQAAEKMFSARSERWHGDATMEELLETVRFVLRPNNKQQLELRIVVQSCVESRIPLSLETAIRTVGI
jgi:hypothetical protein